MSNTLVLIVCRIEYGRSRRVRKRKVFSRSNGTSEDPQVFDPGAIREGYGSEK